MSTLFYKKKRIPIFLYRYPQYHFLNLMTLSCYLLYIAKRGFGCNLYSSGNTIFAENLYISQEERIERIKSKQTKLT